MSAFRGASRAARPTSFLLAIVLAAGLTGCGRMSLRADRYKAERLLWLADRKEAAARLVDERPDSTTLMSLREPYLEVGRKVKIPTVSPSASKKKKEIARDIMRLVGNAQLQAARLAVSANNPELAIETMKNVQALAGDDTLMLRRADFFLVGTLRQMKKYDEAVALMQSMLQRYPPVLSETPGSEDAVLAIPEAIVRLYRDLGDSTNAERALNEGAAYYRRILETPHEPLLDAQVRSRLIRVELEQGDWSAGLQDVDALRRLAAASPQLKDLEPEIRYSEAKLHMMHTGKTNPDESLAMFEKVVKDFPRSPFGGRALFDAGTLAEMHGRKAAALAYYRQVTTSYDKMPDIAPPAFFRRAMLEDQLGDWEAAKNLLEGIPVRFPETLAALEAPMAIANRYARVGQMDAARQAVRKAIDTYQKLIDRDTTSVYGPLYRWSTIKCQLRLDDKKGLLQTVDEMCRKDMGQAITEQALLLGGQVAHQTGQDPRARGYLQQFLANYPKSPLVPQVRKELAKLQPANSKTKPAA